MPFFYGEPEGGVTLLRIDPRSEVASEIFITIRLTIIIKPSPSGEPGIDIIHRKYFPQYLVI